jgi:peptidoglycan/LPS O-acetylase OafA/YrhL
VSSIARSLGARKEAAQRKRHPDAVMNATIVYVLIALIVLIGGVLASRTSRRSVRVITILMLFAMALNTLVFSMNDIRAHGVEVRKQGKSDDFLAGMAERDFRTTSRRIELLIVVIGLTALALTNSRPKE